MRLKKVLLLGDSIRISYEPAVRALLEQRATVVGPLENCQFSLYTLSALARWLTELGNPDVVHWNNGIHDVGHNPNRRPIQMPLDVYVGNIGLILKQLRATGARIIWATMTPTHPYRPFLADQWSWRNEEIDRYNAAVLPLMQQEGVPVDDLHAVVSENCDLLLSEDQLHLSEQGIQRCAQAVVSSIEPYL